MNGYESRLYNRLAQKLAEARQQNIQTMTGQYADLPFYYAAVARNIALFDVERWMDEVKQEIAES